MAASSPQPPAQDPSGRWQALAATERGASHLAAGTPNQDAVATRQLGPDGLVAAVADGHGHQRHFRSARGSSLAVAVAGRAAQELTGLLDGFQTAGQIENEARRVLVPALAGQWRAAVNEDLAAEPFTAAEEAARGADNALIAYGSTLLLALVWKHWLVLAQIGDGDIVGIQRDGRALLPVPGDPLLDGLQTTSLCGPHAEDEFRVAVVDIARTALLGVLLATDGYGNAQAADRWAEAVSADLAELLLTREPAWLADQLPLWSGRCASADGSADDTTIALLIAPSSARTRPTADSTVLAAEAPTVRERTWPASADTLAGDDPRLTESTAAMPGSGPAASAVYGRARSPRAYTARGSPKRAAIITAAVVAAAIVAVIVTLVAKSGSSPRATIPSVPSACHQSSNGTAVSGTAATVTACDPKSGHHDLTIRLPAGSRIEIQEGGSIFVLADGQLEWSAVTGKQVWHSLASISGGTLRLCFAHLDVVADAQASPAAGASPAAALWTEVIIDPVTQRLIRTPSSVTAPLCPGELNAQ